MDEPFRLERPDVLAEAVRAVQDAFARATDYDLIGTAFDVFLRGRYDHAGGLGTHLTPHGVVSMLTGMCLAELDLLADAAVGPTVGDPCCGTGRFLVGLLAELRGQLDRLDPEAPDTILRRNRLDRVTRHGLVGADQSASSVAKARLNLLLLGSEHPQVFAVEDSIISPALDRLLGSLRLIVTNPPFGDGKYDDPVGIDRAAARLPGLRGRKRIDPALAFVVRCLDLLQNDGVLGIVLPDGLVDGPVLRSALLSAGATRWRDVSVEANVSLPTATFALAGTVARTSTLVLRKTPRKRNMVFLGRAEHVGYLKQGGSRVPDPQGDDLPAILAAYEAAVRAPEVQGGGVKLLDERPATAAAVYEGLGTLDPSRIDPQAVAARQMLPRGEHTTMRAMLQPVRRRVSTARDGVPFVSVLHVDELGAVQWHLAAEYRPTTPGRPAHAGEVIVSMLNPSKLRATVIPAAYDELLISSEFGVFRSEQDPWETLVLLYDPLVRAQLAPLGRGTSSSRRRLDLEDLLSVLVPIVKARELQGRGEALKDGLDAIRAGYLTAAAAHR